MLQALMHRIQLERGLPEPPNPCEYFVSSIQTTSPVPELTYYRQDMIGGTSTGGIIAVLLGRLRLSVEICLQLYASLSEEVFRNERWGWGIFQARFDHKILETFIIELLEKITVDSPTRSIGMSVDIYGEAVAPLEAKKIMMYDSSPQACKVFVTATSLRDAQKGQPHLFRTYRGRGGRTNKDCRIWEAIRATSAAPTFFDPIQIHDEIFVDGGFGSNNPVNFVYEEAREMWPDREVGCIISLGTGMPRVLSLHNPTLFDTRFPKNWVRVLERTATECDTAHQDMLRKKELRGKYFRFNVQQGLQGVSLMEWQKLGETASLTEAYVTHTLSIWN